MKSPPPHSRLTRSSGSPPPPFLSWSCLSANKAYTLALLIDKLKLGLFVVIVRNAATSRQALTRKAEAQPCHCILCSAIAKLLDGLQPVLNRKCEEAHCTRALTLITYRESKEQRLKGLFEVLGDSRVALSHLPGAACSLSGI